MFSVKKNSALFPDPNKNINVCFWDARAQQIFFGLDSYLHKQQVFLYMTLHKKIGAAFSLMKKNQLSWTQQQ